MTGSKDDDLIGVADGRETVSNGDGSAAGSGAVESVLNNRLRIGVERRRRLVEQQNLRVGDDGTSDSDALLLPAGEEHATFADMGVVALRKRRDETIGVGELGGIDDSGALFLGRLVLKAGPDETVRDVAGDGRREKRRLLHDEADLVAKPLDVELLERNTVELDNTSDRVAVGKERCQLIVQARGRLALDVLEALDETDDGRLAGPGTADKSGSLADREDAVEVVEHLCAGTAKRSMSEAPARRAGPKALKPTAKGR